MSTTYSLEEIAKHNTEDDIWFVYKDGVYDITKFYKEHPGGEEVLLELAGQDATQCFDDIGHSSEAIILRETFKIGTVGEGASPATSGEAPKTIDDDKWVYQPPKYEPSPWGPVFIGIALAIYGYMIYYFCFP